MAADIRGRTALITGAAKRIGRAVALELAGAGANVVVHYRGSAAEAEDLVVELHGLGVQAWSLQADLAISDEVDQLIDRARVIAGPINILVNNASMFPKNTFDTLTLDALLESMKVDAWAPFALGREFAKKPGAQQIINILDTRVVSSYDWAHVSYLAAKQVLWLFTRMMAIEFAPGVAVNAVAPGLILPPEGKGQAYLESLKDELPLKRIGSPEQVADAILFLVKSEFITGQVIFVDGGRHLSEVTRG